jgi:excinuclease UvrABC helicase subunit UvrB
LRHTLTQLNDAVTQIARSGNLEQAYRVRDLLVQVKREIHTLTQLNDAVTQIARSGNLEQANRVRDLLVQVKREIYKLLAEQ